ncbi:unnamed protein product, partial [Sphacelaria rigidula]
PGSSGPSPVQPPPICPPGSEPSTVKPDTLLGVTPAREAASKALAKSLELARGRVSYLESLVTEVRGDDGDGKDGRQDFAVNEDREPGLVATSAGKDVFGDEAGVQSDAHRDVSSLATGENIGAALAAGEKDEGAG